MTPDVLQELRAEIDRLRARLAELERSTTGLQPVPVAAEPEGLSEELVLVISAAVAAYLGKKPNIRQISLVSSTAWAQQGRVSIQASHSLNRAAP